jgi:hypothetical protein
MTWSVRGPCGVRAGDSTQPRQTPARRKGSTSRDKSSDCNSPNHLLANRPNGGSTLTPQARRRVFRSLPGHCLRVGGGTADMPSSNFIRWSLVGRGVRMAPAHCPSSDAWVGKSWHRRHSRAMAGVATCAHASATREPPVARPFVTKICGTQCKVEGKKDRASRFSSLASIAIARDMRGASRRARVAKGEKWRADRPCAQQPSRRTKRARK